MKGFKDFYLKSKASQNVALTVLYAEFARLRSALVGLTDY